MPNGELQFPGVILSSADGEKRAGTHAQAKKNRRQKRHQRIGRADSRQRVAPDHLSHNQRVSDIIKLLKQISCNHRQGKEKKGTGNVTLCQITIHKRLHYICLVSLMQVRQDSEHT